MDKAINDLQNYDIMGIDISHVVYIAYQVFGSTCLEFMLAFYFKKWVLILFLKTTLDNETN